MVILGYGLLFGATLYTFAKLIWLFTFCIGPYSHLYAWTGRHGPLHLSVGLYAPNTTLYNS